MATVEERLAKAEQTIATLTAQVKALARRNETWGDGLNVVQPPLDSPVIWMRGQKKSTGPSYTTEILSLIHEVTAKRSYAWPLYIQLKTAHDDGESAGGTVRVMKSGNGWVAGYHAETFHDKGNGSTLASMSSSIRLQVRAARLR
jgi:hypothetical protein